MVIPVVCLLLVVVSPTIAITLDTDGAFNARLVDARGIGGGDDSGLGLGFIAAPLIGLAVLAAIAGSTNTGATVVPGATTIVRQVPIPRVCPVCPAMTVCPAQCTPLPVCPPNYQRIGIPAAAAGAGTILQSCYRVIQAAVNYRTGAQLCAADGAVPVELNAVGEFAAVSTLLGANPGRFLTGHTDAFNPMAQVIIGNSSGVPAVGVMFPNGGNAASDCGLLMGVNPSTALCTNPGAAGIICEFNLAGVTCFCPPGTG